MIQSIVTIFPGFWRIIFRKVFNNKYIFQIFIICSSLFLENQAAKEIIFAFAYTMTIFVTLMLMVGQVWLIITLDVCFKWTILALNIFIPFLHPYLSVAIFIASSCLSFVCICFKLRLKFGQRNYQKHQRESVRLDISSPIQPVHQQTINDTIPANENTNANNSNNIYHPLLHLMPSSQHHSLQRLQPLLRPETEQFLEQNLEERTEF